MAKRKEPEYPEHDLDPKELIFAESYILTQNASQAAREAGFPEASAGMAGHRLKKAPHIRAYVEERLGCKLSDLRMSVDDILAELEARAMFDGAEIYEDDGSVKLIRDMSPLARRMLESIETVELFSGTGDDKHAIGLVKKVKTRSADKAFDNLMKFHGLLKERVSHENPDGSPLTPPRIEIIVRDADGK